MVDSYQRLIGRHFAGHSDISRDAAHSRNDLSQGAKELFAAASQGPDLFRWDDDRYHAQTAHYDSADRKLAQQEQSMARYLALLSNLAVEVRSRADSGDSQNAIILMGFATHMIQDLVYHRGMT